MSTKKRLWIALLSVISGLYTDVFLVEGKWFAYSTLMFTLGESTVVLKAVGIDFYLR
jgi:hypothetical protein